MSLDQAKLLFALLALLTNALVAWMVVVWLGGAFSTRLAELRERTVELLTDAALPLAFFIAGTATFGSLYLSEVANLVPCRLCWFQRIAMYPLTIVYGIAWWRRDQSAWRYGVPIAGIGAALSIWHLIVQWFPTLESTACQLGVPCSASYFEVFGFVTIPYMALSGFVAILALSAVIRRSDATVRGPDSNVE